MKLGELCCFVIGFGELRPFELFGAKERERERERVWAPLNREKKGLIVDFAPRKVS